MFNQPNYPDTAGPTEWRTPIDGMTLRDYFAAKAMHGMASSDTHCVDGWAHSDIAIQAYKLADAMLKAREA